MRIVWNISFAVWIASLIVFFLIQPAGFFHINSSNHTSYGVDYTEEWYQDSQGNNINLVLSQSPDSPKTDHIILYIHGTTERLPYVFEDGSQFMPVASATYQGYHGSEGYPTVERAKDSVEKALEKLHESGYSNDKIVVMGHSLGSFSTLHLAKNHPDLNRVIIINGFSRTNGMCWNQAYILCGLTYITQNNLWEASNINDGTVHIFSNPDDAFISADKGMLVYQRLQTKDKKFFTTGGDHGAPTIKQILRESLDEKPIPICDGCDNINDISFGDEDKQPTATIERGSRKIEQMGRITSLWIIITGFIIAAIMYAGFYFTRNSYVGLLNRGNKFIHNILKDSYYWIWYSLSIIVTGLQISWWYWTVTDMDDITNFILIFLPSIIVFTFGLYLYKVRKIN